MDIQKIITDAVAKLKADDKLLENFKKNPTKVLETLVGIDLPDDQIEKLVEAVKAKINLDKVGGLLGGLFGKK